MDCLVDNPVSGLQRFFCHAIMNVAMLHKGGLEPNVAGDQVFRKPNTKQTQVSFDLQH